MSPIQLESIEYFKASYKSAIIDYSLNLPEDSKWIKSKRLLCIFSIIIGIDFEDLWASLAPRKKGGRKCSQLSDYIN